MSVPCADACIDLVHIPIRRSQLADLRPIRPTVHARSSELRTGSAVSMLTTQANRIKDIRNHAGLTLDTAGFEIVISPTNLTEEDFTQQETIERQYYAEIEQWVAH